MNRLEFLIGRGYVQTGALLQKPVFEGGPFYDEAGKLHAEYLAWLKGKNPDSETEVRVTDYSLQLVEPFDELRLVDPFGRIVSTKKINWEA